MNRLSDRTVIGGIALIVVLIVANIVVAHWSDQRVAGTAERVNHTQEVITELDHVVTSLNEAESAERGYIITQDQRYKAPLATAEGNIRSGLERLEQLTLDNSTAQTRIPTIRGYAERRLELLRLALSLVDERGPEYARAIVVQDSGRILMDSVRSGMSFIHAAERQLLSMRLESYDRDRKIALWTNIAGGMISIFAVVVLGSLLQRDMRLRAQVTQALFDQKELFRTTLASIGDAVIATDTNGRIVFINGIAQSLTGWPQDEAAGRELHEVFNIVNEDTREPVENPALRALREGAIVGLANHTILIARDGTRTPIDDSAAPIRDAGGHVGGAVLVFRDITERRRSEVALRDADRHKDEFLAILAHELRNPLAPLRNAVEIMRQTPHDPVALDRVRSMMDRQLEQLVRLTDDLLDVSRITRNKLDMHKEPVDVIQILQSAIETCGPVIAQQEHTLVQDLPSTPLRVDGDRARLAQAFYNLIGNAAKYTDRHGRITVAAERTGDDVVVRIRDTGIGIPQEMQDRIFQLFTQGDRSLARAQGGLGIGLTLVRRIIESHGGTVTVQSAGRGQGSEFIVRLPAITSAAAPGGAPADDGAAGEADPSRARRVLVADDNRDAADTTAMMLRTLGHEVKVCYDGRQALEESESFHPDAALLDIGMPGISGYEVARRIRSEPWGESITLIALTGWGQNEDRRRSVEAGFDYHLVKPVHLRHLREAIDTGRRSMSSL